MLTGLIPITSGSVNVCGESFMELHKLFEGQYKQLEEYIDEVAERINKLGVKTIGTMNEFCKASKLKESPGKYPSQKNMLTELLDDHETVTKNLRKQVEACSEKYKDAGTADFLTGLMKTHETTARLRAVFQFVGPPLFSGSLSS